jgi:hypothetical protein
LRGTEATLGKLGMGRFGVLGRHDAKQRKVTNGGVRRELYEYLRRLAAWDEAGKGENAQCECPLASLWFGLIHAHSTIELASRPVIAPPSLIPPDEVAPLDPVLPDEVAPLVPVLPDEVAPLVPVLPDEVAPLDPVLPDEVAPLELLLPPMPLVELALPLELLLPPMPLVELALPLELLLVVVASLSVPASLDFRSAISMQLAPARRPLRSHTFPTGKYQTRHTPRRRNPGRCARAV